MTAKKMWNRKGSAAAARRMQELRDRKRFLRRRELIREWIAATGQGGGAWWHSAQSAGVRAGDHAGVIEFLERDIAARKADSIQQPKGV